jgi:hypothetical protein
MMAPMSTSASAFDARRAPSLAQGVDGASDASTVGPLAVVITGEDWLQAICPFLRAGDGSWRSASPAREHRCWAVDPPAELPVLTQQRLCLVRGHDGCERFRHARELRSASLANIRISSVDTPPAGVPSRSRGVRRTTVAADAARGAAAGVLRSRRLLALTLGLVIIVMVVLAVATLPGGGGPVPSVPPDQGAAGPSASALPESLSSPGADGMRRYRVREGDTLRTIADRFGVSVRQLRLANDLGEPPRLEEGVVIVIPERP